MIGQVQTSEKSTAGQVTKGHTETGAASRQAGPERVDYVANPEYHSPGVERELFGPEAPTISVPRWSPSPELGDAQSDVERGKAKGTLSRQDEAILFRRYNCARHHMADLTAKQTRRFSVVRANAILTWRTRVQENQDALTQANMALVVAMANRTRIRSVEFEELVSEGNMTLLHAMDKFDVSLGFKFSTYACSAILRAFSRLATKAGTYRQRFPTTAEPKMDRSDALEQRHIDQHDLALEGLQHILAHHQAVLTEVDRTVLGARFALAGQDRTNTLLEVSKLLGLSEERVRQIQIGALAKLRQALELAYSPGVRANVNGGAKP